MKARSRPWSRSRPRSVSTCTAEDPSRVVQDANNERRISQGGYATRQLEELLQNAADAARRGGSRVEVLLTSGALYVANDGEPFDAAGIRSVMASDMSAKADDRIGKFGIGFKSVLAVSDEPKVFSRSVSFGFDKVWAEKRLRDAGFDAVHYPAMRLAKVLDPIEDGSAQDAHLRDLMEWASTVVVAPLSTDATPLAMRLNDFPPEFVLFSPHIERARLRNDVAFVDGEQEGGPIGPDGHTRGRQGRVRDAAVGGDANPLVAGAHRGASQRRRLGGGRPCRRSRSGRGPVRRQVPPGPRLGSLLGILPHPVRHDHVRNRQRSLEAQRRPSGAS